MVVTNRQIGCLLWIFFIVDVKSVCRCMQYQRGSRLTLQMSTLTDMNELNKIFCRMADKYLLLDIPGAGTPGMMNCCHGGCDNCDYSHVFDNLTSGRPKWIAVYRERGLIDGRTHTSRWSTMFDNAIEGKLSKIEFFDRLTRLQYQMSLGPAVSVPPNELPSEDSLNALWDALRGDENKSETITSDQIVHSLKKITGVEHGITWQDWVKAWA